MSVQGSSRWIIVCAFVPVKQSNLLSVVLFLWQNQRTYIPVLIQTSAP